MTPTLPVKNSYMAGQLTTTYVLRKNLTHKKNNAKSCIPKIQNEFINRTLIFEH